MWYLKGLSVCGFAGRTQFGFVFYSGILLIFLFSCGFRSIVFFAQRDVVRRCKMSISAKGCVAGGILKIIIACQLFVLLSVSVNTGRLRKEGGRVFRRFLFVRLVGRSCPMFVWCFLCCLVLQSNPVTSGVNNQQRNQQRQQATTMGAELIRLLSSAGVKSEK